MNTDLSKAAQRTRLLAYLQEYGAIATTEARELLSVMHVAGRIMELRQQGHDIVTALRHVADAEGVTHRQGVYVLRGVQP